MKVLARLRAWGLWTLILTVSSAYGNNVAVTLEPGKGGTDLTTAAMLWHDASGERTLADWLQLTQAGLATDGAGISTPSLRWVDKKQLPLGRMPGALWVAVKVDNPDAPLLRHLVVSPPRLERVDAWLLSGSSTSVTQHLGQSGSAVPLSERPLPAAYSSWVLTLPQGSSILLLRIQSRTVLQSQLTLWSPSAQMLDRRMMGFYEGVETGGLVLATLLGLLFALWLRETTWAWFALTTASILAYQACFSTQAVLWLWPENPQWTLPAMSTAAASTYVGVVAFVLSFIPRRHVSIRVRRSVIGLSCLSILGCSLVWVSGFDLGISVQEFAGLLLFPLLSWLVWRAWRQGYGPARFVLIGFSLLALDTILKNVAFKRLIALPMWLDRWLMPLAVLMALTVLMLVIADRVRNLISQQALEAKNHSDMLQDRIHEATCELRQARDVAHAAAQFKQRLLARVSHDLRTPLHTLLGNSALMRSHLEQLPERRTPETWTRLMASVQAVEHSGDDMLQLTDELLELARAEEGKLNLLATPTDLSQLLQDVAGTICWLVQHQGNQLEIQAELAIPWVVMDAVRVKQVLRNLLSNACTATRNGVITVGMRSIPTSDAALAQLEVWVSDTGRGIPDEALERIFEPFEQLDANQATGGSGLGLAIAQQWVRLMGGVIGVQSTLGKGSTFSWFMQLRVAKAEADPETLSTSPPEPFHAHLPLHGHVLVVDELEDHRQLLQSALQDMGLQVSQATDGLSAIALLQAQSASEARIDLVITDQNRPAGNGQWLLPWCRQHQPRLAVVALSSTQQTSHLFDAFLLKPSNPNQLRAALQALLPPALNWVELHALADSGDGLGVDAWMSRHRAQLGDGPFARGVIAFGDSLQLAALMRWILSEKG